MDDWEGESENDCLVPGKTGVPRSARKAPADTGLLGRFYALLPQSVRDLRIELLQGAVVRLYYSKFTAILYLATLVLAGALLAITLGLDTPVRDAPGALLALETLVTLSLFTEVVLRAVVLGREYLRSWSNILDGAMALASASLMFWAAPRASKAEDFERQKEDVELSQSLVMARIIVQFGRVLLIAEHTRRSRQAKSADDVSFSNLASEMGLDIDLDFSVLREQNLQAKHRDEDYAGL
jgi:hypothetical protein